MHNITTKNKSDGPDQLPVEVFFSNNQKITLTTQNTAIQLKDSTGTTLYLPFDPIGLGYLFKMCLLIMKNQGINFLDSFNNDLVFNSNNIHSQEKQPIVDKPIKNTVTDFNPVILSHSKKTSITYDKIFEIIMNREFVDPKRYILNLRDEEWCEVLLEVFQGRKTYSSGIIAQLKELGLPIDDFQVGRVLKNMRTEGYIRGTEKISKKTNKSYYMLEFPPYQYTEEKD